MRNLAWTPVLLALALTGCPDKDTGETDPGTDTETGTDPDTDTDSDTEADTDPPGPQAGDVVYFEGFETDGTVFPDGWTLATDEGAVADVVWRLCSTEEGCDPSAFTPHNLNLAEGDFFAGIDSDADGSFSLGDGEYYQGTLTSGDIDLSEFGDFSIEMTLDQYYRDGGDVDSASIEVTSDGGTTWVVIQDYPAVDIDTERDNNSSSNGPCPSIYDLSAYAGETIQIRFNYTAEWNWYFLVDNIEMTLADAAPTLPTPDAWTCPIEVCDDSMDNDLDSYADCLDVDCAEDAACADFCAAVEGGTLPLTGMATDATVVTNFDYGAGEGCGGTSGIGGEEVVFEVTADAGDVIVVQEIGGRDGTVHLMSTCSAGDACLAGADNGLTDRIEYTVETAGTFFAVVEGYSASSSVPLEWIVGLNPAEEEDCATAGDEDLNGDADCADSGCADEAACQEVCDSGLDEDFDGDIDCADSDCEDEAQCQEVCDSGMDEDADGLTDCDDIDDCFDTVECPYTCPADTPVAFTDGVFTASGDYADLEVLPYNDGEGCGFAAGPGQIWQVALEAGQQIRFEETGSADTVVRVLDACAPGNACLDSSDTPENLRYQAGDTAETVYFVMEAYYSDETSGAWGVTATLIPDEDCTTDVDEDDDGDIACDDSDCAMDEACFELDCTDGASGDDDELIDCMDPDCDDSPDGVELLCADGLDNDMDGDIDCADSQCLGTASCPEIACDDGLDNDLDLAFDCDDSDCDDQLICYECPDPADTVLPLTVSGATFTDDNPELFNYAETDGCEGGSTFPSSGTDLLYAVDMDAGATFTLDEISGGVDYIVNITTAGCTPADTENVCVYGADFSGASESFSYQAEESGIHYVHVSSYSAVDNDPYEFVMDIVPAEDCSTDVDEDLDGDAACADSDCFGNVDNCATEAICGDGEDNDDDGVADCDDSDCSAVAACNPVFEESFANLDNWIVENGSESSTTDGEWQICDGCTRSLTGSDGPFARADGDFAGSGSETDTTMTLINAVDLSGMTTAELQFTHYFRSSSNDFGWVYVSSDGATFDLLEEFSSSTSNGATAVYDLDAYAGGNVTLRFEYRAGYDWYWLIDDIKIIAE